MEVTKEERRAGVSWEREPGRNYRQELRREVSIGSGDQQLGEGK